mmetsp:Transcript_10496/g.23105  ORF Transcript_10496/g.23105 Transcript_10496/m.23105 type:complete len:299 (+) Transcript_10496:369-1265(+)|eukprot:CAMPEP_0206459488 /NCGR_PEP_ID=MMETSP0324_2-20121206/24201_1 /ASSEMBLY_ACC=CAM_ASM_000836 /TAXON_ID=2866 /ORGANISM="Crypthecodinium cohnii, Strain Seligo" /LENGTH=298 /DNA_ID=CAMNT_0053931039 /DNA_START=365 /DNA_END=1261 /DNA_ORIENTATION=+
MGGNKIPKSASPHRIEDPIPAKGPVADWIHGNQTDVPRTPEVDTSVVEDQVHPAPDPEPVPTASVQDEEDDCDEEENHGTWSPPAKASNDEAVEENEEEYHLEAWQEYVPGKGLMCKCCNQHYDEAHARTEKHKRRLAEWEWAEKSQGGMPAPVQPWLCWKADDEYGYGLYLRCLMCQKWVQDCDSEDTSEYYGDHGHVTESNTKMHKKKLANLTNPEEEDWWQERLSCHPPQGQGQVPVVEKPTSQAPISTVADNKDEDTERELPAGWFRHVDEAGDPYYYTDEGLSQWEFPLTPAV